MISPTTIAAIATPPGAGAVSLIRLSGPDAIAIADAATDGRVSLQPARRARHCIVRDASGETLDDGLLTIFPAPRSYTGETCVEFTGHGGLLVTREVLARFLACGATLAQPGEFTRRAFTHGKIDLTVAEGIMDLISAQTNLALRAARSQLDGHLARRTTAARDEILATLAHLEAWIDFPDEEIDPQTGIALENRILVVRETIARLLNTADQGRILREGLRTVIFGPPNAGKSSLLNRLAGHDRAIVSPTAGTTRDTIEESINFHGIPLRLIDTAGLRRHTADSIETEGISRALHQIGQAGLLIELRDSSQARENPDVSLPEETHHLLVLNKSDLPEHPSWHGIKAIRLSCETGAGLDELTTAIRAITHLGGNDFGEHAIAINARHQECLRAARHALDSALPLLADHLSDPALAAIELRAALDSLADISGRTDTEDLLGVIFSSFCIGK